MAQWLDARRDWLLPALLLLLLIGLLLLAERLVGPGPEAVVSYAPPPTITLAPPTPSVVDLNTVGAQRLATVPGLGKAVAARIVASRDHDGPFSQVTDLRARKLLRASAFARAVAFLRVGPVDSASN